jgi:hypothetical protein
MKNNYDSAARNGELRFLATYLFTVLRVYWRRILRSNCALQFNLIYLFQ